MLCCVIIWHQSRLLLARFDASYLRITMSRQPYIGLGLVEHTIELSNSSTFALAIHLTLFVLIACVTTPHVLITV